MEDVRLGNMKVAKTIERLMTKKNLRQIDMCRAINLPKSTFHQWLQGTSPQGWEIAKLISDYLGVTVDYLLTGEPGDLEMAKSDLEEKVRILEFQKGELEAQMNLFDFKPVFNNKDAS